MSFEVEGFTIVEKQSLPEKFKLVVSLPDVGLVTTIATSHVISEVGMQEIGYFESDQLPPVIVIRGGEPRMPVRIYHKDNLVIVNAEVALTPEATFSFCKAIMKWAKKRNATVLVGITGIPVHNRLEMEEPTVYGTATTSQTRSDLSSLGIDVFQDGLLAGPYAVLMKEAINAGIPHILFLAESHEEFPDPGAAASIIKKCINPFLGLNVNVDSLMEKAEEVRLKAGDLMRGMKKNLKVRRSQEAPSIYV